MASIAVGGRDFVTVRQRFTAAIFVGSFLLFLVQPMLARMALPRLGGAPAVWNSAMLVYQALLLGGYAYAHFLGRLPARSQLLIHLALLALAALTLPLGLSSAQPEAGANSFLFVPWLLLLSVGALFFVISAQAPLLQRWFAMAGGGDPYPLYAASNLGSMLGLLAFPLVLEPFVGVARQSWWWSVSYVGMALLVAWCMLSLRTAPEAHPATIAPAPPKPLAPKRVLRWILLAAVPSGLMLSTTQHLTTDIAAMPLLWVVPLGLYLLSFTIAFAEKRRFARACSRVAPFALLILCAVVARAQGPLLLAIMLLALCALFLSAVAIHAKLFDDRPEPSQLTSFYLAMSFGGVLGGLFCALVAPLVFDWTYEHPILLVAAGALVAGAHPSPMIERMWQSPTLERHLLILLAFLSLVLIVTEPLLGKDLGVVRPLCLAAITILAALSIGKRWLFAMALFVLLIATGGVAKLALSLTPDGMTRSYFGVYSITASAADRQLYHGTTLHGLQLRGSPQRERYPTSYYAPNSAIGRALRTAGPLYGPGTRVGAVGLGTGTLSCYARAGDRWKFYEIDPAVVQIAREPKRFSFMSQCLPGARVILGDARLSLAKEAAASTDVLVLDAFTSDAVPMHLLTREAFQLYQRVLQPEGLLLVHISNRHLDLEEVVAAAARGRFHGVLGNYVPTRAEGQLGAAPSRWIALSASREKLGRLKRDAGGKFWTDLKSDRTFAGWTDDYGSILPIIKR